MEVDARVLFEDGRHLLHMKRRVEQLERNKSVLDICVVSLFIRQNTACVKNRYSIVWDASSLPTTFCRR